MASPHGADNRSVALPAPRLIACQRSEKAPLVRARTLAAAVEITALSMISVELPVAMSASPAVRRTAGRRPAIDW